MKESTDKGDRNQWDQYLLEDAILDAAPPFYQYPNVVLPAGPQTMRSIRSVVNCNLAWKGESPPFDEDGGSYISSKYDEHFDAYFWGWRFNRNQDWLNSHGGYARLGGFSMYVDAATPEEFHRWWARELEGHTGWFGVDFYWGLVASRLPELRWVYIPFSDEYPLGIFVTHPENASWVEQLVEQLDANEIAHTHIVENEGRDAWSLNDTLRKLCGYRDATGNNPS